MGLDITAYSHLAYVVPYEPDVPAEEDYETTCVHIYQDGAINRLDGAREGWYRPTAATTGHAFRAGSYSGYNEWREALCWMALRVRPQAVWKSPEAFAGRPFVELINFSDCEGCIGPVTSAKLAADFASIARDFPLWEHWHTALTLAAQGGFVTFH